MLAGPVNGLNVVFTTPETFAHAPPGISIRVYLNGQRVLLVDDYTVAESGGPGTGFDTVIMVEAPRSGDKVFADYYAY